MVQIENHFEDNSKLNCRILLIFTNFLLNSNMNPVNL